MKKITILGEEFEYKREDDSLPFDSYTITRFYQGEEEIVYRKYIFFGKKIVEKVPKEMFQVDFWIEEANGYTKEELRAILERKVKLLHRIRELEIGELI